MQPILLGLEFKVQARVLSVDKENSCTSGTEKVLAYLPWAEILSTIHPRSPARCRMQLSMLVDFLICLIIVEVRATHSCIRKANNYTGNVSQMSLL